MSRGASTPFFLGLERLLTIWTLPVIDRSWPKSADAQTTPIDPPAG
jgi:hypothetical protein